MYIAVLNIGPPKQAANPILAYPFRARVIFDIRSPILLPQASTDKPSIDWLILLTIPMADSTDTTSVATHEITIIEPTNDPKTANN